MKKLELKNVQKTYNEQTVIQNVNLSVNNGEFVVFVGPSGCGKSTLLRMIAGLESSTRGEIRLNGKALNGVPPSEREVAMVFQSYALYPHMSVEKNIGFPLKMAGMNKRLIEKKVRQTAENLQLTPLLKRLPGELSGGQRQRVAIGRAIVRAPQLFLFDEPLSNLDAKLRGEMRTYLKQLHQKLKSTMIYVTHDQVEAMTLADKIVVLNRGNIEQIGSPEELYNQPANQFVAAFIGSPAINFLDARTFSALSPRATLPGGAAAIGIRPNQAVVDKMHPDCEMKIDVVEPLGHARLYYGHLHGQPFIVESPANYRLGDTLMLNLADSVLHSFDAERRRIRTTGGANGA
ncbi:sn-glycerol-3-phosphate ABC transporter ATP-binding protein UgpC [Brenneria populi]|uniref:Sn-glycerol-3-phosphate ABC transporter ATP-binding protein UgpC n=1 Tax=Brenneria populi TaxID=1505588 RepID=A0ABU6JQ97_9GAMM|nr:sn-glycerol-3-phosphate ABC transporter ATP-binding protein UgpC [Brenneria populi Li et al. 2015]